MTNIATDDPFYYTYEILDSDLSSEPLNKSIHVFDSYKELDIGQVHLPITGAYCTYLNSLVVSTPDSNSEMLEYIPFDQSLWIKIYKSDSSQSNSFLVKNWQEVAIKKCILIPISSISPEMPLPHIPQSTFDLPDPQPPENPYLGINTETQTPEALVKSDSIPLNGIDRSEDISESKKKKFQPVENKTMSRKKEYLCAICKKPFFKQSDLTRHWRVHTGEKPYPCKWPECEIQFADPSNRKRHQQTHLKSTLKPFLCEVKGCQAAYSRKYYLKKHQNTHIKEAR